jgi:hypothetical protein
LIGRNTVQNCEFIFEKSDRASGLERQAGGLIWIAKQYPPVLSLSKEGPFLFLRLAPRSKKGQPFDKLRLGGFWVSQP